MLNATALGGLSWFDRLTMRAVSVSQMAADLILQTQPLNQDLTLSLSKGEVRHRGKAPSSGLRRNPTSPPKGEVARSHRSSLLHLSLGGEVGAQRRVRGPFFAVAILATLATPAFADPTLKTEVDVAEKIVTVGDMFTDAGSLAARPLFLAPAPGTSGSVGIDDIRVAALKAGIPSFDADGMTSVEVSRLSTPVDADMLTGLISIELGHRGLLPGKASADATYDTALTGTLAAAVDDPVQLASLQYAPESGLFSARFLLAGQDDPLDVSGHLDLMVGAPALTATLPAGTILKPTDFTMQKVALRLVQNGNVAGPDQLVGKQLTRQSLAGMVLKASDVADPQLVSRNDLVTVYLHAGPMTLTVRGTALNAASLGQPVAVMNAASKKIVHGIARADGAVEVSASPLSVAGL